MRAVEEWRANLILPTHAYWHKWTKALRDSDPGGLLTARKFVERWCDCQPGTAFEVKEQTNGRIKVFECISEVHVPLLGLRKVVSYGCNRASLSQPEAISNSNIALVSRLYQDGKLDSIYKGTIASRKFMAIYEEAARYGLHPRFKLSMLDDRPGASFYIRLDVPEWKLFASASARTYISALARVVDTYESKAKIARVKTCFSPQASKNTLDLLTYTTAHRALKFLLQRLQLDKVYEARRLDDPQGPQWTYNIYVQGFKPLEVPTIRQCDARYVGITTTVVRLLQRFGFDKMHGFKRYLEVGRNMRSESACSGEKEKTERAVRSQTSSPEYRRLDPNQDILSLPDASSRYSRGRRSSDMTS
ncbi:hypothetical protein M436DRAFT_67556 [Aureobasidium namibiae CBS 147.97]|uniref:Uncharacterized protein n=1 Tax=Aureobasidium namibiae CBS 147.97 TaxID=1043004 RepID=A0A074X3H5_9PEZI|nr:uncharacterized protein M436DRAFT_67556 [Aureobasidium namibiae CBS 147.97]KEQ69141.1 hypothetical protein M436DRAFT_67556 [Aureobasidium namibiae CBS 147.97]